MVVVISQVATEAIENIETVQALTREHTFHAEASDKLMPVYRSAVKRGLLHALAYAFGDACYFFAYGIAFRFGAFLVQIGDISADDVFVYAFCCDDLRYTGEETTVV